METDQVRHTVKTQLGKRTAEWITIWGDAEKVRIPFYQANAVNDTLWKSWLLDAEDDGNAGAVSLSANGTYYVHIQLHNFIPVPCKSSFAV